MALFFAQLMIIILEKIHPMGYFPWLGSLQVLFYNSDSIDIANSH